MWDKRLLNINSTNSKGNEVKTNCSYTFNTDVDGQRRTLPDTYSRRSHAFVYLSAQSWFVFYSFTCSFIDECLHHPSISTHPSIHHVRPSVRPFVPSVHLFTSYACHTYPQLIIYRFCIHKNKFFDSTIGLFSHACLPARLLAYAHLVKSYLEQYGHIVPQLTEFRSIHLSFFSFTLCMRSEDRNSNWRWTRRFVRKNPWPLEKAWASARIQRSRVARL